ncbi:MAG: TolC family protein [Gemmataceae bacterium]|jgi:outer membrane protein TolC|nr:TolC family protein [Gemmataceae bacterium]
MWRHYLKRGSSLGLLFPVFLSNGCISIPNLNPVHQARQLLQVEATPTSPSREILDDLREESVSNPVKEITQARAQKAPAKMDSLVPLQVKGTDSRSQPLPIDLVTTLRLVDDRSPIIGFARARLAQAQAKQDQAEVLWLPHLSVGAAYNRFDGQTQNQRGEVFEVNRANLFGGGGAALTLDISDALFEPLIAQRTTKAEFLQSEAIRRDVQLNAALAYLDLLAAHGLKSVALDSIARAERMLKYAKDADAVGIARSASDINRAQTELYLRQAEAEEINGRIGAISARLAQLLALNSVVELQPMENDIIPFVLIDSNQSPEELLMIAVNNRPDLAAHREQLLASIERLRKQQYTPFLPKIGVFDQVGRFGGGLNDDLSQFGTRHALSSQVFWELRNFGFGNRAQIREQQAITTQQQQRLIELEARITAEVSEAYRVLQSRAKMIEPARKAVEEALVWYRKALEMSENALEKRGQFDTLEPVRSIQALHAARQQYLNAVIEHNKAQYRLFAVLGYPANLAKPD